MYNLIEHIDNYLKTFGILWQYYRDEPAINDGNGIFADFTPAAIDSFKIKEKITGQNKQKWHKKCWNNGTIKYLCNFGNSWNAFN